MAGCALFLLFLSLGLCLARPLGRSFEQALPLVFAGVVSVLYIAGLCGATAVGVYVVWALGSAATAWLFAALLRPDTRAKVLPLLTPGVAAFALVFTLFWLIHTGRRPARLDEFSHWAIVVKNLWFHGGFGNGAATNTVFHDYPPAMALLEYFFAKAGGGIFREDMCYRGLSIFLCAVQFPLLSGITWRQCWKMAWVLPLILVLPAAFFGDVYRLLLVDGAMALLFAAILSWDAGKRDDKATWWGLGLLAALLTLTKTSGFALCLLALGMVAVQRWRQGGWRVAVWVLVPLVMAGIAQLSWRIYYGGLGVTGPWGVRAGGLSDLWALFQGNAPAYRYEVLRAFAAYPLASGDFGVLLPLSPAAAAVFLAGVGLLWALVARRAQERSPWPTLWALAVGGILYLASLLALYLFVFHPMEAVLLASISRYLSVYFWGVLAFFLHGLVRMACTGAKRWHVPAVAGLCALLVFPWINLRDVRMLIPGAMAKDIAYTQSIHQPYDEVYARLREVENPRVYVVAQEGHGREGNQMRYATAELSQGTSVWNARVPLDTNWADELAQGGYTHVYVCGTTPDILAAYGGLFVPVPCRIGGLYRVKTQGTQGVALVYIDTIPPAP